MLTFLVHLKSGQTVYVKADHWDVVNYEFQEADSDDPPRRQVTAETVGFYDDEGTDVSPHWYLPWDQVAAIVSTDGNLANADLEQIGELREDSDDDADVDDNEEEGEDDD